MGKRLSWALFLLFLIPLLYGFFLEPNWLAVYHYELVGNVRSPIKIAHLSDLHLRKFGFLERKLVDTLKAEIPDIILVTGDTLDDERSIEVAWSFFHDLAPPLGVWGVLGNWENWSRFNTKELFLSLRIKLLKDETAQVRTDVALFGFDDAFSGKPDRALTSQKDLSQEFCIALFHSPAFFDKLERRCPLSLAGHTHGGQLRLPFFGPLWLPPESGPYVSGWYESNGSKLYVSRGTGTSILPIRFMSRPEISFITIRGSI
jgi:predicted MPP superfamily phosphohydrolase